jgi:hypothetical protein
MRRQIAGLHAADHCATDQLPDGLFLVRVQKVQFRRQAQKPYYTVALAILEPGRFAGRVISSRLYCNPTALWKFNWFLRDFGYDVELLGRDEVDESQLIGLTGVVKISHVVLNGTSLLRLDGGAIAIAISTAGKRKTLVLRCSSGVPSNRLWAPTFAVKIPGMSFFVNGRLVKIKTYTFRTTTLGIACSSRGSCSSPAFARTTASEFTSRGVTCKSSSLGQSAETNSSPTLMGSGNLMGHAACWNGRHPPTDIPKNPRGYWLSIPSSFAIPG